MILAGPSDTSSSLIAYGPILVATGGIIVALVSAMSRKDKKQNDQSGMLDKRTNTALEGLSAALDRSETERAYWQKRAEDLEEERDLLDKENDDLRSKIPPARRPRKQP